MKAWKGRLQTQENSIGQDRNASETGLLKASTMCKETLLEKTAHRDLLRDKVKRLLSVRRKLNVESKKALWHLRRANAQFEAMVGQVESHKRTADEVESWFNNVH